MSKIALKIHFSSVETLHWLVGRRVQPDGPVHGQPVPIRSREAGARPLPDQRDHRAGRVPPARHVRPG
jgi:hypothetical protein